jgi:hypothetical protein
VKGGGAELDVETVLSEAVLLCEPGKKGRGTGSFLTNAAKQTLPEQSKIPNVKCNGFLSSDGKRIWWREVILS